MEECLTLTELKTAKNRVLELEKELDKIYEETLSKLRGKDEYLEEYLFDYLFNNFMVDRFEIRLTELLLDCKNEQTKTN